jgi:hypothetical protein
MDSLKVQESFQRRRTGSALNRKKSGAALREMVAKRNAWAMSVIASNAK